jgi:hypothetical protein
MLSIIRQLAFDHPDFWDQKPAKAMLDFHSDKLLQIRQTSLTRKALILQMYTYLRDASSKGFYHKSMTESLWDHLLLLSSVKGNEKVGRGAGGSGGSGGRGSVGTTNSGGNSGGTPRCRMQPLSFPEAARIGKGAPLEAGLSSQGFCCQES